MNREKIEELAVNAVKQEVLRNPYLKEDIPTNDKTPSWDGEIFVYNSDSLKKNSLYGRVPVQVKGKEVKSFSDETAKFSLKKADLKNYLTDGGIIFIFVEVQNVDHCQIYFHKLLPIDIKFILKELGDRNSISKKFDKLQDSNRDLEFICKNFIHHRKKQGYSLVTDLDLKIEDFQSIATTIISTSDDYRATSRQLLKYGTYLYGRQEGLKLDIPLYKINIEVIKEEDVLNIGVGDKTYYSRVIRSRTKTDNIVTLEFGNSFRLRMLLEERVKSVQIDFKENGTLEERIYDSSFLFALAKSGAITINSSVIEIDDIPQKDTVISDLEEAIEYYKELITTFDLLNVTVDFDLFSLSKNDILKAEKLRDIVLYHDYSSVTLINPVERISVEIGPLKFLFWALKQDDTYLVFDIFDSNNIFQKLPTRITAENNESYSADHSFFLSLEPAKILSLSNLQLDPIKESLLRVDYTNSYAYDLTHDFLLKFLKAYDDLELREHKILDFVYDIYTYLETFSDNFILIFLNKMQVVQRKREFTTEEKREIISKKKGKEHLPIIMCGLLILLDNPIEFEIYFEQLKEEEKEAFKYYPIYNLLKIGE